MDFGDQDDLDFAFELQLQETMEYSRFRAQQEEEYIKEQERSAERQRLQNEEMFTREVVNNWQNPFTSNEHHAEKQRIQHQDDHMFVRAKVNDWNNPFREGPSNEPRNYRTVEEISERISIGLNGDGNVEVQHMAYSLLRLHEEEKETISEPGILELLLRLEQELKDAEELQELLLKLRDLKIQIHDYQFAQELLQVPEDEWQKYGDNIEKPFDEDAPSEPHSNESSSDDEANFNQALEMVAVAALGAAVSDARNNLISNMQRLLIADWRSDWTPEDLQLKAEISEMVHTLLQPEMEERDIKIKQEQKAAEELESDLRRIFNPFGEGSSSSTKNAGIANSEHFRLYFKGLQTYAIVGENSKMVSIAAIGAAVCDSRDNLILNVQKPLVSDWDNEWEPDLQFKVEVKALIEALNTALSLGIKRIDVFCDYYPLFHYIGTVVDRVCSPGQTFDSCRPFFVARQDVKFAFKLARDAIDAQINKSDKPAESNHVRQKLQEKCDICLEDTDVDQMFAVDGCSHRYCLSCMKQHAEVKLLHGAVPNCPSEGCNTQLGIPICAKFLSPQLIELMEKLVKESSIPVTEKIYCPYPRCSALMSRTELLLFTDDIEISAVECVKCLGLLCITCEVPWHHNMTCREYKRRNPNSSAEDAKLKSLATTRSWRQCTKCKNMIELAEGCYHMTCRCGYEFCYTCGAEWRNRKATCTCPIWDERYILNNQEPA